VADEELERLRERIRALDLELVDRAAERLELARQVGEIKRRAGLPIVDYAQERVVLERVVEAGRARGLGAAIVQDLFTGLIRAAVTVQDEDNLRHAGTGAGKVAVVVGGAGRMGRWVARFLSAQGYAVALLDPAASPEENDRGRVVLGEADLVVCSTPPAAIARLYEEWCATPPRGVIFDIASIKTPLVPAIRALQRTGACVGSIHPMFGPSAVLLREADVVICDTGDAAAAAAVAALFAPTTAHVVHLGLDEHDRVMADLLSLAHATAIAFAVALPPSDHPVRSTTFRALELLAGEVVRESPDVYFEIQAMNPHSAGALERLRGALDRMVTAVSGGDPAAFRGLLDEGRKRTERPEP
jgi:chorismate mutase/prephenate dehydrogenase